MRTMNAVFGATALAAAVALPSAAGIQKAAEVDPNVARTLTDEERLLMHYTVIFEECVGIHLDACKALIQAKVEESPEIFEHRSSLTYEVMPVRTVSDEGYNYVGLRTNEAENGVVGILGDGMVFYPWDWCDPDTGCGSIGPWDCDIGTPLSVEECCNMIKASVPHPDVNGNYLECHPDYPVGSVSNPTDYGRVCIHVNGANIVVHAPKNE
jgi:hypothetical protein